MYTDPDHLRVEDPGKGGGQSGLHLSRCVATDKEKVEEIKAHYQRGGLGDSVVKKYLLEVLQAFLEPIRVRRAEFAQDPKHVMDIVMQGREWPRHLPMELCSKCARPWGLITELARQFSPVIRSNTKAQTITSRATSNT